MTLPGRRGLNVLGAALCFALLGYAWYVQGVLRIDPCPLCIFQRAGIGFTGLMFLFAALHHPRGWGRAVWAILIVAGALATAAVAARHVWIQHQPPGSVPTCGATLDYLLDVFPLTDVIRKVLTGSGECARVTWTFLSLSMPAWVLMAAAGLGGLGVYAGLRRRP